MSMENVGKVQFWDVKPFIDAADILVASDEPLRALKLLENLPGYYRDHVPPEVIQTKKDIYALLATPAFYVNNPCDQWVREDQAVGSLDALLRGQLIEKDVKDYNDNGRSPHVVDLGPGEYWLPLALQKKGYSFNYRDIGLCGAAKEKAMKLLADHHKADQAFKVQPTIFVACELIEHLHHEEDIRADYERARCDADIIHISTPKYTWDCRKERLDWRKYGDLGHLRTYTPNDFQKAVIEMFPGYRWNFYDSQVMHLRGEKI